MSLDSALGLRLTEAERRIADLEQQVRAVHEASLSTNADDEHDPEGSTIAYERAQLDALVAVARTTRDDLVAALERVDAGTYGRCQVCGAVIPAARLEVRPQATTCVEHPSPATGWIGPWSRSSRRS